MENSMKKVLRIWLCGIRFKCIAFDNGYYEFTIGCIANIAMLFPLW